MFEANPRSLFPPSRWNRRLAGHRFLRETATWKVLPKVNPHLLTGVYLCREPSSRPNPSVWGRFFLISATLGPVPVARYAINAATLCTGVDAHVCSTGNLMRLRRAPRI